ncbi:hypothetical protein SLA2020_425300 [Shorea laevis]
MSITNESSLLCYFDHDTLFFISMKSVTGRYHKANEELHKHPNPTSEVTVIIRELNFRQIFPESIEAYVPDIVMFCCKRNTRATKPTIEEQDAEVVFLFIKNKYQQPDT